MSRRILLSGSTGLIGSAFHQRALAAGDEVIALRRGDGAVNWNPLADAIDPLPECDAVVHLAAAGIADRPWSPERKQLIRDSRALGTALLARHLAQQRRPPRVLVCASAVGFYGDTGERLCGVGDQVGTGFLAEVCDAWEAAADPAREAGLRVVHLRFGVVLAAAGGAVASMRPAFVWGLGGPLGRGRQWLSWIGLSDACRMIERAINDDSWQGPVDAVAPEPIRQRLFARQLGKSLGRPAVLPMPAMAVSALFGEMGRSVLLSSSRVSGRSAASLGFDWHEADLAACLDSVAKG